MPLSGKMAKLVPSSFSVLFLFPPYFQSLICIWPPEELFVIETSERGLAYELHSSFSELLLSIKDTSQSLREPRDIHSDFNSKQTDAFLYSPLSSVAMW